MQDFLQGKVFRIQENLKKIDFILRNSRIKETTIVKAANIARNNPFHNFGHQIGVAESAIKIAIAEKRSIEEITTFAFASLVHDAGHKGIMDSFDEIRALELTANIMDPEDFQVIDEDHNKSVGILRDLIMATVFIKRGQIEDVNAKIMQDADLAHLGQGIPYWLWASMGLIEEFGNQQKTEIDPIDFIRNTQEKFVEFLASLSETGTVYLSRGANRIFRNPLQDVQAFKEMSKEIIMFAYDVRKDDITLDEFKRKIEELN